MPTKDGRMKAREWLFYTEDLTLATLGESVPGPRRRVMWTVLQFYWDTPAAHFELQPQPSRSLIEVGLHFEGRAEQNEAWAARITPHTAEIQSALGGAWELEEWTASWRRLHRVYHFDHLTGARSAARSQLNGRKQSRSSGRSPRREWSLHRRTSRV
ncbi:MAG: hypothetical protein IPN07_13785 [Dehalococcoidia bacterium]|nr:hypothetical protein [Dehalococcoidia bacterium]